MQRSPPPELVAQYGCAAPKILEVHDTSHGENDVRHTFLLRFPDKREIALKIAKNAFTTPERVTGWAALAAHYNQLGIYAPQLVKTADGVYYAEYNDSVAYAEEVIDGVLADALAPADGNEFRTSKAGVAAIESLGVVAAQSAPLVPWHTAWSLYDPFCAAEQSDENSECAHELMTYIMSAFPRHAPCAQGILNEYRTLRAAFESTYRALPRAVFQGDFGAHNIVLTKDGDYKGVCDFNLSGTDAILNILFCECRSCWSGEAAQLSDVTAQQAHDSLTARLLRHATKYYRLTDAEKCAFTTYYNITYAFRWENFQFLLHHLRKQGEAYVPDVLGWIKRQMSRDDVWELLP